MTEDRSHLQSARRRLPLDAAWRHLGSGRVAVLLLALSALALGLAATIPQAPSETMADPQALQRWLATSPGIPSWAAAPFTALGLFHILHSLWFRFLLGLTALSLLIVLLDGLHALRRPAPGPRPSSDAPELTLPVTALEARARLLRLGFQDTAPDLGQPDVRHLRTVHPARWGVPLLHAGLLVALVGIWVLARWGWHGIAWTGRVGQSHPIGHGTPYQVRLDAFDVVWTTSGRVESYTSRVTVLTGGVEIDRGPLTVGRPLVLPAGQVRQLGLAPRVSARARDDQGRTQLLESPSGGVGPAGEIALRFAGGGSEHFVTFSGRETLIRLVYDTQTSSPQPAVRVEVQAGADGELEVVERFHQSGQVRVGDLVLDLDLIWEPILRADHIPGAGLVLGGWLIALAGAGVALARISRGVWLRADGEASLLLPGGAAWETWWPALRARLEADHEA
jgi:hypothetical protein